MPTKNEETVSRMLLIEPGAAAASGVAQRNKGAADLIRANPKQAEKPPIFLEMHFAPKQYSWYMRSNVR